jgi:hypothetical protein
LEGAKVNATCFKKCYKLKFFSRKCDFFWGNKGKEEKITPTARGMQGEMQDTFLIHPTMPKMERPLSGGYGG